MPGYLQILSLCAPAAALIVICVCVFLRGRRLRGRGWRDVPPPEVDERQARRAAESLSQAIRFQTVSHASLAERGGYGEWVRLREALRQRYPLTHKTLLCENVGFSLLYRWAAPVPAAGAAVKAPVLLCAHTDVVPAEGAWSHGPFEGDIADGYVWGRGALDCKNVVICILEAVESLLEEGVTPARDIFLAFGHDEELGGADGAGELAALFAERNARFEMVLDEGGSLCRSAIPVGRPVAHIGVAEKGMADLRFTAREESGSASRPPRRTALGRLSEALCRLEFRPLPPRLHPMVRDSL
ncbi:MAG: M20/M25/M40 family metallo-hydrolase, partial [Oscillospiraceae bacterium]|nr:M20/M25/M40 family metallo-hydrolase [Oscillospiraceae bacterium]